MSISVMIADDHKMVREGLHRLLETDGDICVASEAADGFECLDELKKQKADVVILNINMPKLDGISTLKKIKEYYPEQKVIILTGQSDIENLYKVYNIGIDGFVMKESSYTSLVKAIKLVYSGGQYIEPTLIPQLKNKMDNTTSKHKQTEELLTKRELQILVMVAEGLYNKEIANKLGVTEKTVKNHITNLFKKIEVTDRIQAAVYAMKNGYVNS